MKKRKKVNRPIREPSDHSEDEIEEDEEENDGCFPQMNTPDESTVETDAEFSQEDSESDN